MSQPRSSPSSPSATILPGGLRSTSQSLTLAFSHPHPLPLFSLCPTPCRYDDYAFERIADSAFGRSARAGRLEQVTFLRMGDLMFDNWDAFSRFLKRMRMLRPPGAPSP